MRNIHKKRGRPKNVGDIAPTERREHRQKVTGADIPTPEFDKIKEYLFSAYLEHPDLLDIVRNFFKLGQRNVYLFRATTRFRAFGSYYERANKFSKLHFLHPLRRVKAGSLVYVRYDVQEPNHVDVQILRKATDKTERVFRMSLEQFRYIVGALTFIERNYCDQPTFYQIPRPRS